MYSIESLPVFSGLDHTVRFVRGFVTCPYSESVADKLVNEINQVSGLAAHRLEGPLYANKACPVVVEVVSINLEADGTINSRDALFWFAEQTVQFGRTAEVAETWWNIRSELLGRPHGSRSSLFVNQYAGAHIRKVLEALNNSGVFGPIKESSLEMLSRKKRDKISQTLLRAALNGWTKGDEQLEYEFELRGETCKANVRDTWVDGFELSIRVEIGNFDLYVSGFYYKAGDRLEHVDPKGKRALAEKFL